MPYFANIYRVLIASPSDVEQEREAICEVLLEWNALHGRHQGLFLEPVRWETHTYPAMGRPQGVINEQIGDKCDMLIGVFWKRLGSPTGKAESGTEEEIERYRSDGRPVMLYFSKAPIPAKDMRSTQYQKLQKYKRKCMGHMLVHRYDSISALKKDLLNQLDMHIHDIPKNSFVSLDKGVRQTLSLWSGAVSDDFILKSPSLRILLKDGHTLFSERVKVLKRRLLNRRYKTEILILHPDYKHITAVAEMDSNKRLGRIQRADCLKAIHVMKTMRREIKLERGDDIVTRVDFIGYHAIPTWNGFISDQRAFVFLYPTLPSRGELKVFEVMASDGHGNTMEWYVKYLSEYNQLRRTTESESDNWDLWFYKVRKT